MKCFKLIQRTQKYFSFFRYFLLLDLVRQTFFTTLNWLAASFRAHVKLTRIVNSFTLNAQCRSLNQSLECPLRAVDLHWTSPR